MSEEVKINFYRVHKCGYYHRGQNTPEFGSLYEILSELNTWAYDGTKPLAETCTYELDEEGSNLHTYCFDIKLLGNKDVILTTWNETETLDGGMASVNGADPAGNANVNTTSVPLGHIPGYPTYFWFIPEKDVFATLRFNQRANGHRGLKLLLSEFTAKFTSYVVYDESHDNEEEAILGYKKQSNSDVLSLSPYFKSYPAKLPGQLDFLRENRIRITKIIRKNVLMPHNQDDRTLWQKFCGNLGLTISPQLSGELKMKVELPFTPEENELNQIISEWESENGSSWNNVGFELRGEDDIKWLSHSLVKSTVELEVVRDANGVISAESIANAILTHRVQLLRLLS